MPEITREEAKALLLQQIDAMNDGAERLHGNSRIIGSTREHLLDVARALRLALAALEDAERIEWLEEQILATGSVKLHPGFDGGCELEHHNGSGYESAPTVRTAIDRARGA